MKKLFLIFIIIMLNISCEDNPVKSENQGPEIISVVVFPEIVKPNDSLIVICNAADPDGDALVYDWYTSGVVRIYGLPHWDCCSRHNTFENSQIFFAPDSQFISAERDSFRIECAVRDGKGGQDSKVIYFKVKKE